VSVGEMIENNKASYVDGMVFILLISKTNEARKGLISYAIEQEMLQINMKNPLSCDMGLSSTLL